MDEKKRVDREGPKEDVIVRPVPLSQLENVQTKSIVKTSHELAEQELARVAAQNAAIARAERSERRRALARKVLLISFLTLLSAILLIALIWLVVNVVLASRSPAERSGSSENTTSAELPVVEGYACKTAECGKIADLPDGRIILRDAAYYLYNPNTKDLTLTAIDEQDYAKIRPFEWGEKIYAELDPETGASALFSISENRTVTGYDYDTFYSKIDDAVYKDMTDIAKSYIVARASGSYRIIDLASGNEVARGSNSIFTRSGFFVAYEAASERRVYALSGRQIISAPAGSHLYVTGGSLVYLAADGGEYRIFDQAGNSIESGTVYYYLDRLDQEARVAALDANRDYYKISNSR